MANEIMQCLYLGDYNDAIEGYKKLAYERIINAINLIEPNENGYVDTEMLDALALIIHKALESGERVLVHCNGGMERSPLVVAWYMVTYNYVIDFDEAYKLIKNKRLIAQDRTLWLEWEKIENLEE